MTPHLPVCPVRREMPALGLVVQELCHSVSQHATAEGSCCNRGRTSDSCLPETALLLPRLGCVLGMLWLLAALPGVRLLERAFVRH